MSDELRCGFCEQPAEGLTLYHVVGRCRLMVCAGCYAQLLAKIHQPYARVTRRAYRLVGLATGRRS